MCEQHYIFNNNNNNNISKCEIIAGNSVAIHDSSILSKSVKVTKDEMTFLGAPVVKSPAQDAALTHKIDQLKKGFGTSVTDSFT